MKSYGGVPLLHIVFNLGTRWWWSASRFERFISSENVACTHWLEDGAGPGPGYKVTEKTESVPCWERNPDCPVGHTAA